MIQDAGKYHAKPTFVEARVTSTRIAENGLRLYSLNSLEAVNRWCVTDFQKVEVINTKEL
jgi:hypothetical protein